MLRILELWAQARARHGGGGPYLFGDFGAVDIMFAPVVTRFVTYSVPVPRFAAAYMETILDHAWMKEWIEAAQEEPWVIEQYEAPQPSSKGQSPFLVCVRGRQASLIGLRPCAMPPLRRRMQVDVGIVAVALADRLDRDEDAGPLGAVDQMVAVGDALREGRAVAGAQHGLALVLDQHRLAFEHDDELVLALVPVALAGDAAGLEHDMADAEIGQARRPARSGDNGASPSARHKAADSRCG